MPDPSGVQTLKTPPANTRALYYKKLSPLTLKSLRKKLLKSADCQDELGPRKIFENPRKIFKSVVIVKPVAKNKFYGKTLQFWVVFILRFQGLKGVLTRENFLTQIVDKNPPKGYIIRGSIFSWAIREKNFLP
ncbi:hypothetical protein J0895_18420 [Phormidium pseudopriestleyi FRX01]|uniref:Uncharacterized protein n=1 Tax=Phormidium pseudopriestleyi FRX01 TaxID=1759528 RepID=A0ABS3FV57_9CYAN|nr:hypothetical protein [Phormidium pseudopriestleyi]MBO0351007.1 hypothetical protein [Phormidium pseudopriestleyi FRX01]